ncbi:MAG: RHS repeat domain-containing protein [Rhodanobacter sp.]
MDLALAGWTSYNGLANTIGYDSDLRPIGISVPGVENMAFSYDAANRITQITNGMNATWSQSLSYDPLDRLTAMTSSAGNESYQYDAVGNRTHQVGHVPARATSRYHGRP